MLQKSGTQKSRMPAHPQGAPAQEQRTAGHTRNFTLGTARASAKQRGRPFVPSNETSYCRGRGTEKTSRKVRWGWERLCGSSLTVHLGSVKCAVHCFLLWHIHILFNCILFLSSSCKRHGCSCLVHCWIFRVWHTVCAPQMVLKWLNECLSAFPLAINIPSG